MERSSAGDGAPRQAPSEPRVIVTEAKLLWLLRLVAVVVGVSPVLAPYLKTYVLPPVLGDLLYEAFDPVCHKNPARTLSLAGTLLPICSRCTGIFLGFVTAGWLPKPKWSVLACLGYGFVASVVMVIDVVTQDMGLHPVSHPIRILTGVLWGHVFALGIFALAREHVAPRLARLTSSA